VARSRAKRNLDRLLVGKTEGETRDKRHYLAELGLAVRFILKWILTM
jgi:hypothetical protein